MTHVATEPTGWARLNQGRRYKRRHGRTSYEITGQVHPVAIAGGRTAIRISALSRIIGVDGAQEGRPTSLDPRDLECMVPIA